MIFIGTGLNFCQTEPTLSHIILVHFSYQSPINMLYKEARTSLSPASVKLCPPKKNTVYQGTEGLQTVLL